jgi:hypothetical protein
VVVTGEHVLGVSAGLPLAPFIRGLGRSSHWGLRLVRRGIGVLVVAADALTGAAARDIVSSCEAAGLAGIAVVGEAAGTELHDLAALTTAHRMFLVRTAEAGA